MKVILLTALGRLGKEGDVAEVKDGYARNYLIPEGKALRADSKNFQRLEDIRKIKSKAAEKEKGEVLKIKEQIEQVSLTIVSEAKDDEELYGSIGEAQIVKALRAEKIDLDKESLSLDEPIRKLGVYKIKVSLHPEVEAALRVWVVRK